MADRMLSARHVVAHGAYVEDGPPTRMTQRVSGEASVRLRKPLERSVRSGHPWVYRAALEPFDLPTGSTARLLDKRGRFLARGWIEHGPIGMRVLTTKDRPIDERLLRERLARAFDLRAKVVPPATSAYRLLHGEGDRLPGVVIDRYGRYAVLRLDGEAALTWRAALETLLARMLPPLGVVGLVTRTGRKSRRRVEQAWGEAPPEPYLVEEHGMRLYANLWSGQKTGLFLDHRESRALIRRLSKNARVLNLYGYTGGFSVAAGLGGARSVTTVDIAKPALALADASWAANGLDPARQRSIASDVAAFLEGERAHETYDLIVADPPNFAPSEAARPAAARSYESLHRAVLGRLSAGSFYLAASCSSHITRDDFEQSLIAGAAKARRIVQVLERGSAPADHPRLLAFPEGDYLKVALCRVL